MGGKGSLERAYCSIGHSKRCMVLKGLFAPHFSVQWHYFMKLEAANIGFKLCKPYQYSSSVDNSLKWQFNFHPQAAPIPKNPMRVYMNATD